MAADWHCQVAELEAASSLGGSEQVQRHLQATRDRLFASEQICDKKQKVCENDTRGRLFSSEQICDKKQRCVKTTLGTDCLQETKCF